MHIAEPGSLDTLHDGYRVVRALAPPETVFPGVLVRKPDGETVLHVRVEELDGWGGWTADAGGHVLGVLDLASTREGAVAELPWCTEPLETFLDRRRAAGAPLTAGESVTLAVSVLRAIGEVSVGRDRRTAPPEGRWWLTDTGRPVLALSVDASDPVDDAASRILRRIAESGDDGDVSRVIDAMVADLPERLRRGRDGEDDLFAVSAPEPLDLAHERARLPSRARPPRPRTPAPEPEVPSGLRALVSRHLDVEVAEMVATAVDRVRARKTVRRAPRRAVKGRTEPGPTAPRQRKTGPIVVGAAVAAVAIVAGVLWPTEAEGPADAVPNPTGPPSTSVAPTLASTTTSTPTPSAPADDPVATAEAIFTGIAGCADDACRAALVEDAALVAVATEIAAGDRTITLLDDFGDVVALRVDAPDTANPTRRIVIARADSGWRLRAVYEGEE